MLNSSRFYVPLLIVAALGAVTAVNWSATAAQTVEAEPAQRQKLTIVWSSGDPEVAHRMVLMYAHAAKTNKWFEEVRVIVWGPSSRLTAADKEIQGKLKAMKESGVILEACVVCADSYGVADHLRELGIDVKPMGKPLTDTIKDDSMHLVTF
jgi:hypothetical protein